MQIRLNIELRLPEFPTWTEKCQNYHAVAQEAIHLCWCGVLFVLWVSKHHDTHWAPIKPVTRSRVFSVAFLIQHGSSKGYCTCTAGSSPMQQHFQVCKHLQQLDV